MSDVVASNRTAYKLIPGKGYRLLGTPSLPDSPLGVAAACEPLSGTLEETQHYLLPPVDRDAPQAVFTWYPDKKEWECFGRVGKRVGFTSAYLAAYGWTYGGVV